MRRVGANAHIADGSSGAGSARPQLGFKQRLLHCNRLNHIEKPLFMSITSGVFGCKYLCAAKPLFRQGKGIGGFRKVIKVSRTSPGYPATLEGQDGPEIFKGRRRACALRRIPDRFPVTAGIRSETATRPLG